MMRIGILTDIHENTAALINAIRLAELHNVDELACLGDITGYDTRFYNYPSRSARECVRLIKSNCRWVVAGNHDLHASRRIPSYANGFSYPGDWFLMSAAERKKVASGKVWCYEGEAQNDLSPDEMEFVLKIPEFQMLEQPGGSYLFSHYIFPDFCGATTQYAKRNSRMEKHWDFMHANNLRISFIGHSHNFFAGFAYKNKIPFLHAFQSLPNSSFTLGDEPVVVMLPPVSGEKGRTGFSVMDTETMNLSIVSTATS